MAILASDAFARANGNLGANWTSDSGAANPVQITSNSVTPNCVVPGRDGMYWNAISWPNDQYAQVTLTVSAAGAFGMGPAVRVSSSTNFYQIIAFNHQLYQYGCAVGGVVIATHNIPTLIPTVGDVVMIMAQGSVITCFVNGVNVYSLTDTNLSIGNAGLGAYGQGTATAVDNWSGGNLLTSVSGQAGAFSVGP
jgi:hypothetical protein